MQNKKLAHKIPTLLLLGSLALTLTACTPAEKVKSLLQKTNTNTAASDQKPQANKPSPFGGNQSSKLTQLLSRNQKLKCTYKNQLMGQEVETVMYTDGTNIFMEAEVPLQQGQENQVSNTIIKDDTVYLWTKGSKEGIKLEKQEPQQQAEQDMEADEMEPMTRDQRREIMEQLQNIDYSCETWADFDKSVFDLPEGVEFSNPMEQIESMMPDLEEMETQMPSQEEIAEMESMMEEGMQQMEIPGTSE
ncbi:hypothetical protein GF360_03305 [candidate division WWE3 bacterium]|nr:hypothetical protein [candidate division WWE3 bacterium]